MEMGKADFNYSHWGTTRNRWNESSASKKEITPFILYKGFILSLFLVLLSSCGSSRKVVVQNKSKEEPKKTVVITAKEKKPVVKNLTNREKIELYIQKFGPIARKEMQTYGIPASITLAQGILESGMGYGRLATEANNHFGIKCHSGWTGKKIYHDDDRKGECFRVYKNPETSYRDHSLFLKNRSRYAFIFDIRTSHYKGWAKGLKKAGYATDPKYPDKLISLIERFDLTRFDDKKMKSYSVVKESSKPKSTQIHVVSKGDTLYSVSKKYNISLEHLVQVNKIKDQTIYLGQELKIPSKP
jgi:flagellum-specific peptidoglycan hydrolase FlgJ